jgi:hypothetical protein
VLAVFAATVAVVHFHAHENGTTASHCLLCATAHSPSVPVTATAPLPPITAVRIFVAGPRAHAPSRLLPADLFIRPPPAEL